MIRSMTGYGQAENGPERQVRLKVEARSVNHRYLDSAIRMPREIQALEDKVRKAIQAVVHRGRVDIFITWRESTAENVSVLLDRQLAQAYHNALIEVSQICALDQTPDLQLISRFPDVLRVEKQQLDLDEAWVELEQPLKHALDSLVQQRTEEGERLTVDFRQRLETVEAFADQVAERAPIVAVEYRKKLEERLRNYLESVELDPSRLLTEAAMFADRSSITEELTRLKSHLAAFRQALGEAGPVGRKLDFLSQELFREVNTIGSKANDYEITRLVVEMKSELEKIREQVQNIE